MITSPRGVVLEQQLRRAFAELVELDKYNPQEATELVAATISTIRSWKPQALLVTEAREESPPRDP